jgi:hypothetical protein
MGTCLAFFATVEAFHLALVRLYSLRWRHIATWTCCICVEALLAQPVANFVCNIKFLGTLRCNPSVELLFNVSIKLLHHRSLRPILVKRVPLFLCFLAGVAALPHGKALALEQLLLSCGEYKLSLAVRARQRLVTGALGHPFFGRTCVGGWAAARRRDRVVHVV